MMDGYKKKVIYSGEGFENIELKCCEPNCQLVFNFTPTEQEYFAKRMVENENGEMVKMHPPKRCPECRQARKIAKMKEKKY